MPHSTTTVDIGQYAGVAALITTAGQMHDHPSDAAVTLREGLARFAVLDERYRAADHTLGLYGGLVMAMGRIFALFFAPEDDPRDVVAALDAAPACSLDAQGILDAALDCAHLEDHQPFYRHIACYLLAAQRGSALFEAASVLLYALLRSTSPEPHERWMLFAYLLHAVDRAGCAQCGR